MARNPLTTVTTNVQSVLTIALITSVFIFCRTIEISHDHGWREVCESTARDRHDRCAVAPGSEMQTLWPVRNQRLC